MALAQEQEFRGTERFQIQSRLGAGAFGVVYRAFDRERGAVVALKALRGGNVEALFRLKREFRALADVSHPNLVALHELLAHEEQWFFTMELVEGAGFLEFIRDARPHAARPDRIRSAIRQAVAGLQALHEAGLLHRDIKPSNVLVSREGRLVLLDFGMVTDFAPFGSRGSTSIVGTPTYMSPEQGSGLPLSPASDWYSLGVMLFEALTGQLPFTGSFVEMMWDKRHRDPPRLEEVAPATPSDLASLCSDLLQHDPERRPTGEQILARLGGVQAATFEPATPTSTPARRPEFVGRQAHLSQLRSAFEATRAPKAVIARLHGPSGVGKTALVNHFLEQLRGEAVVVLAGRCYERETVPYKALDSLVDALSQFLKRLTPARAEAVLPRDVLALARLFPVLRRVEAVASARRRVLEIPDSQELRRRAFAALRELLARLAEQNDVVLFIDDLQWGDTDSAILLADLLRPPQPPPLLLIACHRDREEESSPFLKRFLASRDAADSLERRDLPLGELSTGEARDLARALLGRESPAPEAEADAIARDSGGNPFFLDELVRFRLAGVDRPEQDAAEDTRLPGGSPRRTALEDVIRARVMRLPEPARRLLEVLAVAGRPLRLAVARFAAGLGDDEDPVAMLSSRHLIRSRTSLHRNEIEPYHDRIRETVVASLSAETLKAHHWSLAMALEGSGTTDPEALALHFQEAGHPDRAAEFSSVAAARAFDALAFNRAARLYRLALELGPVGGAPARRILSVKLGDALSNAGHGAEAARAYLDAAPGSPEADALELRRRAAEQFLISGHIAEGTSALRVVLAKVGMRMPRSPRRALVSMLWRRGWLRLRGIRFRERDAAQIPAETLTRIDVCWSAAKGLTLSDLIRANDFQARHLLMALRAGEPYRIARALAVEAAHSGSAGGRARKRTARLLEAATSLGNRIGHPHAIGITMSTAGVAAYCLGEWRTALELTEKAGTLLRERCRGVAWELDNTNYYGLLVLFYLGEMKRLQGALPGLLKEAEDRGDLYAVTSMRTRLSYLVRLANDQAPKAREELQEAIAIWPVTEFLLQHWYELIGQVECLLYAGETAAAWRHANDRWPLLKRSFLLRVQPILINSLHFRARAAIAAAAAAEPPEDPRRLLRLAEKDAHGIERQRMPWAIALSTLVDAGIASARGQTRASLSLLASAEERFQAADMALHAATARRRRGELTGGEAGRTLVETSSAWMRAQGIQDPERMAAMLAPGSWS